MPEDVNQKLKALTDIASINITSDFDEILNNILKITCKSMNSHSGTIMLHDEKTDELRMVAKYGLPDDYIEQVYKAANKAGVPIISSPSGTVLKTGHYYIVSDVSKEPKDKPWWDLSRELGFNSQIFTPMIRGVKVIGLLNVYMADKHHFTEEEINFITIAAHQASSVVHNAKMCSKLKNNVAELNEYKVHLEEKIKESHKKLFLSENYLRTIIESSFDGIFVIDNEGRFEFGNDGFFTIIGYPKNEIIGHSFMKVIHPDYHDFIQQRWEEVQRGEGKPYEVDIVQKDGTERSLSVSHTDMEIGGEKKYCVIAKDITERNRSEEEARLNSEIFKNVSEGIFLMGMEDGLIKHTNSKFEQMFGYGPGEMIGKDVSILNTPTNKTPQEAKAEILNFLRKNEEWHGEIQNIRKDGTSFWSYANASLFDHRQYGRVIVSVHTDITQRKQAEEKLRESEEKYRDLFENAQDPMFVMDIEANFLKVNKIGIEMLECTKEEITGTNISRWATPESLRIIHELRKKRQAGENVNPTNILEMVGKNNGHKWVEIKTRFSKSDDGRIEIHGIARDITENRFLKQELNKSNKQQKLLCHLIQGTRGGKTRALILKHISERSCNANQLATTLNMDYKTIRHHLNILIKNQILSKNSDGYSDIYFISNNIDLNLNS